MKRKAAEQIAIAAVEACCCKPATKTTHLIYDLGGDSLDQVEIIMWIEKELGIHIQDEEASLEKLQTVNDFTNLIVARG